MSKLNISQTFFSVQGEGPRTGVLSVWLRTFGCNLRCPGFFQQNPTKPETYINSISFDPKSITRLEDFPVVDYGCDTIYAIDPRFKHLRRSMEIEDVKKELLSYLPSGEWIHPKTGNAIDLCITGGEPLLQQAALSELLVSLYDDNVYMPATIQIETNGLRHIESVLSETLTELNTYPHFNVSPKLFNVSGENYVWTPEIIESYMQHGPTSLKIVINSSDAAWEELDGRIYALKQALGYLPPIYVMPVGSTFEQQSDQKEIEKISNRAIDNGYHISGRLQCILWENSVDK